MTTIGTSNSPVRALDGVLRRYTVLRVLGAWAGVSQGATGLAGTLGGGLGKKATEAIPMTAIHAFNKAMRKQILFKWASRTGTIRLGSALPFGIGAGNGGTSNYFIGKALGRAAISECGPSRPYRPAAPSYHCPRACSWVTYI